MDSQKHVDEIMDWFDFNRVAQVMKFLDWEWLMEDGLRVPCESEIREKCRKYLSQVYDKAVRQGRKYEMRTGGFTYLYDPQESYMKLDFVVAGWETNQV